MIAAMEALARVRVGVLDDHTLFREALSALLDEGGLEVVIATGDPEEFIGRLTEGDVAVALVDLGLQLGGQGAMDGFGVLSAMKLRAPVAKSLVLSASSEPSDVSRCYQAGADGYLSKVEASPESLLGAITSVLNGNRVFPLGNSTRTPAWRPDHGPSAITHRERQVLSKITVGHDNLKIAAELGITERTVKAHVHGLYTKLDAENRVELALLGGRMGLAVE